MKTVSILLLTLVLVIFLGVIPTPANADSTNGISIQDISVQPSYVKVGDTFTVTATLVNNSTVPIILDGGTCVPVSDDTPFFTVTLDNHAKINEKNLTCAGVGLSDMLNHGKSITGISPDSTATYVAIEHGTANVTVTFSYHAIIQRDPIQTGDEQTISKSFQFQIHDVNSDSSTPITVPKIPLPLQQFRSGITANHIICKKDLYVILKAENGFPACVSIETGKKLALRGWATTFGTSISTDYWLTCNKPFPKSDSGTAVLYMPTNSIGKICLSYSNLNSEPESVNPPGISDPNNSYQKPKDIVIWTYTPISTISNTNGTTVAYFIKTGNQTGFYGLSLPSCGKIPFAVGYNNDSKIVSSDFPFLGVTVSCPPGMLYPDFDGIEGIEVKYIP